jgi:hypothetical protein
VLCEAEGAREFMFGTLKEIAGIGKREKEAWSGEIGDRR